MQIGTTGKNNLVRVSGASSYPGFKLTGVILYSLKDLWS